MSSTTTKRLFLHAAKSCGLNAVARAVHRNRLLVLCYHSVVDDSLPIDAHRARGSVSVSQFRSQLEIVKQHYRPISGEQLHDALLNNEPLPESAALVTFDDGLRNNLTHAAPELERLNIPAIFFVCTGHVGQQQLLWPHLLDEIVLTSTHEILPAPDGNSVVVLPASLDERAQLAGCLQEACMLLPDAQRRSYLEQLSSLAPVALDSVPREVNDFLNWSEIRELACRGFHIGSHTIEHPILTRLTPPQLRKELQASKARIELELEQDCFYIAYPNGSTVDYSVAVIAAAKKVGYQAGFTLNNTSRDPHLSPMTIDRINVGRHLSTNAFLARLSGLASLYHRLERSRG